MGGLGRVLRLLLWLVIGLAAWSAWQLLRPISTPLPFEVEVRSGQSLRSVADELAARDILPSPLVFTLWGRATGVAGHIKPGIYHLEEALTPLGLLHKLAAGEVLRVKVTLIEGWNLRQVRAALTAANRLQPESVELTDLQWASVLQLPVEHPEGMLFPDTYMIDAGASDLVLLRQAAAAMQRRLETAWANRAANLPYRSPYEALIMASIIEKETGLAAERPLIAAVFINRLRMGMPLQTDPTVIYGLGPEFDGNLRRANLQHDTPFNTYTRRGLPPRPIALSSAAALAAVLHPADTRALYFVARGDGSHVFSETLEAHNRAVRRFQVEPAEASSLKPRETSPKARKTPHTRGKKSAKKQP